MIIVCSLKDLESVCDSVKPSHVISVIDPGYAPETPIGVKYHLKLEFDDIIDVDTKNQIFRLNTKEIPQLPPNSSHSESVIEFTKNWNKEKPIVIHCWCGVSRSMATATYLMCKEQTSNIDKSIRYIRSIAPHANPNKVLIKLFESSLDLDNQITRAFANYPHTKAYDCSVNFAPITIFDINDMKDFK